jgi:hypothetical protein
MRRRLACPRPKLTLASEIIVSLLTGTNPAGHPSYEDVSCSLPDPGVLAPIRSGQADLFLYFNRREMRKIGIVNGVGARLGVGCAKSAIVVVADLETAIELRVTADFALVHE